MHEQDLALGFERRNSQQAVINESNTSPDSQSFPTDMNVGSTVYRSLYAEQVSHLTKYVNKLAQYPDIDVMLIVVSEEPSGTNFLGLPQKNIFTFASLKLQPLLARIERDPRFGILSRTDDLQGDDLAVFANVVSSILLAFSLLLSLSILASVFCGVVLTATVFVSSLAMFLWGRVMVQRKSQTEYQPSEHEMDQNPDLYDSKENVTSSNSPAKQAEIANLQAAITGVACDISTNGTKVLFRLESEEATFSYGSSKLKKILANISSHEEPQTTIRNLDKRIDYMVLCMVFSTAIVFDITMYFKWYYGVFNEIFICSAFIFMIFNSIFAARLLYMYANGIE
jgi:hypothetical protein